RPLQLPPGTYIYKLNGRVLRGSIAIGVLDSAADRFVAEWTYAPTGGRRVRRFAGRFRVARATQMRIVLSNADPRRASRWHIRSASLSHARVAARNSVGATLISRVWSF